MATYEITTEKGTYRIETADASEKPKQAASPLDYRTGNDLVDAPLGVVQGALKGLGQTTYNIASAVHRIPGVGAAADKIDAAMGMQAPTQEQAQQMFEPRGVGQGTGKFLEQTAEFMVPAAKVGTAVKGAGMLARAAAQGALGAGVSGAQSNFDPTSTAVGGALGAGGEVIGAGVRALKAATGTKAITGANVSSVLKATPTEKLKVITPALDMLKADGIKIGNNPEEMHQVIKDQIVKLGDEYQKLPANIKQRSVPARDVVQALSDAQKGMYIPGTQTVASGNKAAYNVIQEQIKDVAEAATANNGNISVEQLTHLKNVANENTHFGSADQGIYRKVGDAYRQVADTVAPELTELNKKYQKYQDLRALASKAVGQMRGESETGLTSLLAKGVHHATGGEVGSAIGAATGIPGASTVGRILGTTYGPKLGASAKQALQNAIDSGAFSALQPSKQIAVKAAAAAGRNSDVIRLLGRSVTMEQAAAQ